jgi:hypothetical protein
MKIIRLPSGHEVLVDDADYDWLASLPWRLAVRNKTSYAQMQVGRKGRRVYMHRMIMGEPDCLVDHRNRNGLDNQRHNLRLATQPQNQHNRGPVLGTSSRFKGVRRHSQNNCWVSHITFNKVRKHLGTFVSEEVAALAYDQAARELAGEFAKLNFPDVIDYSIVAVSRGKIGRRPKASTI